MIKLSKFKFNLRPKAPKSVGLGSTLTVVFLLILAAVIFVTYNSLYKNIFVSPELVEPSDIVRVDLKSYQQTIDLIESLENYVPPEFSLPTSNIFD
jgi:hypothetical protein